MSDNMVITIERQYASGGLEIGKNLSQKLNIPFYSREIVEMAAERCDIPKEYLESTQENVSQAFYTDFLLPQKQVQLTWIKPLLKLIFFITKCIR